MGASFVVSDEGIFNNGVIVGPSVMLINTSGNSTAPTAETADYDGGSNSNLLAGTDGTLAPGDQVEITFTVLLSTQMLSEPRRLLITSQKAQAMIPLEQLFRMYLIMEQTQA